MSTTKYSTFTAPSLDATLEGLLLHDNQILQFRGLKYATVQERFALPTPKDSFNGAVVDCTKHGAISPDMRADLERSLYNIPEDQFVPNPEDYMMDEFDCLNLTVTRPAKLASGKFPVVVFIHGGSNVQDSITRKVDDLAGLVLASIDLQKPMIGVAMGFRHRFSGFSTVNGQGNHALYDQRCALEWVHKHIGDFGGDVAMVTLIGDSAGAVATDSHLHAPDSQKLFRRAILMSGCLGTLPLKSVKEQEVLMKRCCTALGVEWVDNWVEELKKVPKEEFGDVIFDLNHYGMSGTDDGHFHGSFNMDDVNPHCEAIMMGTTDYDSTPWRNMVNLHSRKKLVACVQDTLGIQYAAELIKNYSLDTAKDFHEKTLEFIMDVFYTHPMQRLAKRWRSISPSKKVFEFVLDQLNPFRLEERAMHGTNLVIGFGNYHLPDERGVLSVKDKMQNHIVKFVNGVDPWDSTKVFAYGPDGECGTISIEELDKRRRTSKHKLFDEIGAALVFETAIAMIRGRAVPKSRTLPTAKL